MSQKIKVSIVEDCFLTRIALKHGLSIGENIEIIKDYDSADELIREVKQRKPDIVLMDLDLAGMNGVEATQKLKLLHPEIKVIILTEHTGKDFFKASMFAGAHGFVIKSTETPALIRIIQAVYFGAYWFDPLVANTYSENFPKPDFKDLWNLYNKKPANYELTVREMQVLKLLAQGKSNPEIAKEIIISANTAKAHVGKILNKMQVNDRVQAAVIAAKSNLI